MGIENYFLKTPFTELLFSFTINCYISGDKTAELSESTGLIRDGSEFVLLILTLSVIIVNTFAWTPGG